MKLAARGVTVAATSLAVVGAAPRVAETRQHAPGCGGPARVVAVSRTPAPDCRAAVGPRRGDWDRCGDPRAARRLAALVPARGLLAARRRRAAAGVRGDAHHRGADVPRRGTQRPHSSGPRHASGDLHRDSRGKPCRRGGRSPHAHLGTVGAGRVMSAAAAGRLETHAGDAAVVSPGERPRLDTWPFATPVLSAERDRPTTSGILGRRRAVLGGCLPPSARRLAAAPVPSPAPAARGTQRAPPGQHAQGRRHPGPGRDAGYAMQPGTARIMAPARRTSASRSATTSTGTSTTGCGPASSSAVPHGGRDHHQRRRAPAPFRALGRALPQSAASGRSGSGSVDRHAGADHRRADRATGWPRDRGGLRPAVVPGADQVPHTRAGAGRTRLPRPNCAGHDGTGLRFALRGSQHLPDGARWVVYAADAYPPGWTCFDVRLVCIPRWDYQLAGGLAPPLPPSARQLSIYAWDWAGNASVRDVQLR